MRVPSGNDLSDIDSQRSGESFGSDMSGVSAKSKDHDGMGCYNMLKILNNLLYLVTLCFAIGYFQTMKFTSKFVFYAFEALLITRPALILFYSVVMCCLEMRRSPEKDKKKKIGMKDSDLSDFGDSVRSDQAEDNVYQDYGENKKSITPGYEGEMWNNQDDQGGRHSAMSVMPINPNIQGTPDQINAG